MSKSETNSKRLVPKLRLGNAISRSPASSDAGEIDADAKQSFENGGSQAGAWEPVEHRQGKSLIELLVVISMVSIVLTLSARTIGQLMRAERIGSDSIARDRAVNRLASDFRNDVHAAINAKFRQTDDGFDHLTLGLPDEGTVVYEAADEGFTRTETRIDGRPGRETYRLGKSVNRIERVDEGGFAALIHERSLSETRNKTDREPTREYRIEAALRRDRRYMKSSD